MLKIFESDLYNAQFLRVIGNIPYHAADLGECLQVKGNMPVINRETWFNAWFECGERNYRFANLSLGKKLFTAAHNQFLRACTYYRASYFFLEDKPNDPRIALALNKSIETFHHAIKLMPYNVFTQEFPYKDITLPAYLYFVDNKTRPTVIICAGGDGTKEEAFVTAMEALAYGYNCVCFEGPGQGSLLRNKKIPFVPDWENVLSKVIDYIARFSQIDLDNLIYYGRSFGGFLGARAVTYEKRIKACILDTGQYDGVVNLEPIIKKAGGISLIDKMLNELVLKDPNDELVFKLRSRLWRYGVSTWEEFVKEIKQYSITELLQNIKCNMLVLDNEEEYLSKGQAKFLYDHLTCPKHYHLFTAEQETGGHCQPLSLPISFEYIFNWLNSVI